MCLAVKNTYANLHILGMALSERIRDDQGIFWLHFEVAVGVNSIWQL
jgi:hypothetical protein